MFSAFRLSILLICVVTAFSFAPVFENDLVDWDDQRNLVRNDAYQGLSLDHLRWMFTTGFAGHYQPLTWLSFALDYQAWGVNRVWFHLINLALHVATSIALFFVALQLLRLGLERPTGYPIIFGALLATLLFAVHPLRVESVAWATERRDVLSGAWLTVAMISYLRAAGAERPAAYRTMLAISLLCYVLSLLSKAAGITLPVVLFVLDIWPLRRLRRGAGSGGPAGCRGIMLEKGLFLLPAVVIALVALWAQAKAGALRSFGEHSVGLRIGQACYGIMFYPWKTFWPIGLAPLYEQSPDATPLALRNVVSGGLVILLSVGFWVLRKRRPAFVTAWAVYIVVLSPVLGLAQSGPQVVADRYSYLSCMPWAVLIGAGVARWWSEASRGGRAALTLIFLTILILLVSLTRDQTRIWKDSRTLWSAVIERGGSRGIAHANLATVLNDSQEYEQACEHARKALDRLPGNRTGHIALARCSLELGQLTTAEKHYTAALDIAAVVEKTDTATMVSLAIVKTRLGKFDEAEQLYRAVVAAEPDSTAWHHNLAGFLASRGRILEAKECFEEALRRDPAYTDARFRLGVLLLTLGDPATAIATFEEGLRYAPEDALLRAKLAWVLATCSDDRLRDGGRALALARQAPRDSVEREAATWEALAAALAETGDFQRAVETLTMLLSSGTETLPDSVVERLESQLDRYRRGQPMRE